MAAFDRQGVTLDQPYIDLRSTFHWDYATPEPVAILISDVIQRPEINVWVFENSESVNRLMDVVPSNPRLRFVARDNVVAACIDCTPSGWEIVARALDDP